MIDLLWFILVVAAADIIYRILFWALTWGLSWSNTIIALFIFMGCPVILTIAWWAAVGMGSFPIKTKLFLVLSELVMAYCAVYGVVQYWHVFASINGGWDIAMKIIYSLITLGVYVLSGIFLYINSKDRWNDNLK